MNIKETLKTLRDYYLSRIGVGHTQVLLNGVIHSIEEKGCILIHANKDQFPYYNHSPRIKLLSVYDIDERIHVLRKPIAIDNYAHLILIEECLSKIEWLDKELYCRTVQCDIAISGFQKQVEYLQQENKSLHKEIENRKLWLI